MLLLWTCPRQRIVEQIRADQAQSNCSECVSAQDYAQQKKLTATDGAAVDLFGYSVAICGDTVVGGRVALMWAATPLKAQRTSLCVLCLPIPTWP